jgi:hypothetical protein
MKNNFTVVINCLRKQYLETKDNEMRKWLKREIACLKKAMKVENKRKKVFV